MRQNLLEYLETADPFVPIMAILSPIGVTRRINSIQNQRAILIRAALTAVASRECLSATETTVPTPQHNSLLNEGVKMLWQ